MTQSAYLLLGLTAVVGALAALLVYAVLRFGAAARQTGRRTRAGGAEQVFVTAALQDAVTALKAQERASTARADASERLSAEIIASMASGLLVVGTNDEVRILNPAGRRMLGLADELPPVTFHELLGFRAQRLVEAIDECLRSREPIVRRAVDVQPGRPGSGSTHLGVTVSPMIDGATSLQGAICLFSDLTTVVELEEQLRLKDSLARLGELTAGLAHEFRNGLATIHGYSRLFDVDRLPADYRPYITAVRQETEALGQIVTNFLNFARPAELSLATVSLEQLAERAVEEIRQDVQARGGTLEVRGRFAAIQGDEVLLRQAISNLCRNALEACAQAGSEPRISIEGEVDDAQGTATLTVTDNGPGIEASALDRIFRPFFTTKPDGTGLGLALVQKIVVTHNGRLGVETSPAGTRMRISLPLEDR